VPFGVLLQTARNAANEIAADLGHLCPSGVSVGEIETVVGNATEVVVTDPDKIGRHDVAFLLDRDASTKDTCLNRPNDGVVFP
jgi:MinD superfamily P-loop ATPase